jgi:hypothetical protein
VVSVSVGRGKEYRSDSYKCGIAMFSGSLSEALAVVEHYLGYNQFREFRKFHI